MFAPKTRWYAWLLTATLLVTGCGTTSADTQEDEGSGSLSLKKLRSERYIEPLFQVQAWPFDDGNTQYRLYWNGGDSKLPIFEQPDPNSKFLGEATYTQGQEIQTAGDFVAVYQPATFKAKRSFELVGLVHEPGTGSHGATFTRRLAKGDAVSVYMYARNGNCYLGVAGRTIVGACPNPDDYVGTFEGPSLALQMQPITKIWWVYISTPLGAGWLPLDDRVLADILPLSATPKSNDQVRPRDVVKPTDDPQDPVDPPKDTSGTTGTTAQTDQTALDAEAEMFGDGEESQATETSGAMGQALLTDEEIAQRLESKDDTMALGAYALMQAQYDIAEYCDADGHELQMPTLLDVYLDAQPNDRVRGYVRGRLTANFTQTDGETSVTRDADPNASVALDQLWLKFDAGRALYATVGKQRIKWGTGRFWNPTDFVNSLPLDALNVNVLDRRLGVTMAKLHLPVESLGWNFYGVATLDGASSPYDIGGALRAEFLFDQTEFALSAAYKRKQAKRVGLDFSTGFWLLELRAEGALLIDDPSIYYEGDFDLPSVLPREVSRKDDLIAQGVGGFELQIPYRRGDLLVLGAEGFYNQAGYDDASLYPWMAFNNAFKPFYAGKLYAGAFMGLMGPGDWDDTNIFATAIGNLSDRSNVARLDISQTVHRYLRWNLYSSYHFGDYGEFRYALDIRPNIFTPEGVQIIAPLVEIGGGLQLEL